jgi:hypothetical protein
MKKMTGYKAVLISGMLAFIAVPVADSFHWCALQTLAPCEERREYPHTLGATAPHFVGDSLFLASPGFERGL